MNFNMLKIHISLDYVKETLNSKFLWKEFWCTIRNESSYGEHFLT